MYNYCAWVTSFVQPPSFNSLHRIKCITVYRGPQNQFAASIYYRCLVINIQTCLQYYLLYFGFPDISPGVDGHIERIICISHFRQGSNTTLQEKTTHNLHDIHTYALQYITVTLLFTQDMLKPFSNTKFSIRLQVHNEENYMRINNHVHKICFGK